MTDLIYRYLVFFYVGEKFFQHVLENFALIINTFNTFVKEDWFFRNSNNFLHFFLLSNQILSVHFLRLFTHFLSRKYFRCLVICVTCGMDSSSINLKNRILFWIEFFIFYSLLYISNASINSTGRMSSKLFQN